MSRGQFQALLAWLVTQQRNSGDVPKLVASPSILLPRHRRAARHDRPESALRSDGWDGYPCSFHWLLAHIAGNRISNVVFLSGDEHLSCVAKATITTPETGDSVVIHPVHSSPLFAPFPFANSIRAGLPLNRLGTRRGMGGAGPAVP
jgi:phosphodiesterase/alkaline phosphatase D-like protein